ncbi:hypothetical protein HaLaN_05634, partial [Haematococcus lacustris]
VYHEESAEDTGREDLRVLTRSYLIAFNAELDRPGRILRSEVFGVKPTPKRGPAAAAGQRPPPSASASVPPAAPSQALSLPAGAAT